MPANSTMPCSTRGLTHRSFEKLRFPARFGTIRHTSPSPASADTISAGLPVPESELMLTVHQLASIVAADLADAGRDRIMSFVEGALDFLSRADPDPVQPGRQPARSGQRCRYFRTRLAHYSPNRISTRRITFVAQYAPLSDARRCMLLFEKWSLTEASRGQTGYSQLARSSRACSASRAKSTRAPRNASAGRFSRTTDPPRLRSANCHEIVDNLRNLIFLSSRRSRILSTSAVQTFFENFGCIRTYRCEWQITQLALNESLPGPSGRSGGATMGYGMLCTVETVGWVV